MAEYEIIHEIFNQCSGNQMRDVFVSEEEIEDVDAYMDRFRIGKEIEEERSIGEDGSIIYDLVVDGLKQRVGFSKI